MSPNSFNPRFERSSKWQLMLQNDDSVKNFDVVPYTVAEMEIATAPVIVEALKTYLDQEILGYTVPSTHYYSALNRWFETYYNYTVNPDSIVITPGVIASIRIALHTMTAIDEGIVLLTPAYNTFFDVISKTNRRRVSVPLVNNNGFYSINYELLEEAFFNPNNTLFILCSPHNPIGRVWTQAELQKIHELAMKHDVIVISDEIHCDLIMPGSHFISYHHIDPNAIILTSVTKSFNLAGLKISNALVPDPKLKKEWENYISMYTGTNINALALRAVEVAYTQADTWLHDVIQQIHSNYTYLVDKLQNTHFTISPLEATYLLWIENKDIENLCHALKEKHIHVGAGLWYGATPHHIRINLACSRKYIEILAEALLTL